MCIYKDETFTALRKFTIWHREDDNGSDFGGDGNDNGGWW